MKTTLSLLLSLVMVLSLFAGIPSASAEGEELYWLINSESTVTENNIVLQELRKRTGVNVRIEFVAPADYDAKLNALIANDTLPDIFSISGQTALDMRDAGKLLDMTEYLSEYGKDILAHYAEGEIESQVINQNGGIYGLNNYLPYLKNLVIRKDWLANVGKEIPTTLDELYDVMLAFAKEDPDRNGEDDTYGYVGRCASDFWQHIFAAYGIPMGNKIVLEDGTVTTYMKHPNYLKAIEYVRRMYADGILDPDFGVITNNDVYERFWLGKMGLLDFQSVGTTNNWYPGRYTFDVPEDPADIFAQVILKNVDTGEPAGASMVFGSATTNKWVISSKCAAPADAVKLLNYIFFTDEGEELTYLGIEGTMFEWIDKEAGKYRYLGEYQDSTVHRAAGGWVYNRGYGSIEFRLLNQLTRDMQLKEREVATQWAYIPANLESVAEYGSSLTAIEWEAFASLIVTNGDVNAEYQAFIDRWNTEGGLEYEAEATEWWAANK